MLLSEARRFDRVVAVAGRTQRVRCMRSDAGGGRTNAHVRQASCGQVFVPNRASARQTSARQTVHCQTVGLAVADGFASIDGAGAAMRSTKGLRGMMMTLRFRTFVEADGL